MLVAERDVTMDIIANRLDAGPAGRRLGEELPGDVGQAVGLVSAGSSSTGCWGADGATTSGRPESRTTPSPDRRMRPAGATRRLHQLP